MRVSVKGKLHNDTETDLHVTEEDDWRAEIKLSFQLTYEAILDSVNLIRR